MRILFTGGGTGGHIFPILAIIRELKRVAEEERILDLEIYFMGPTDFAKADLEEEQIIIIPLDSGKMRRYFSLQNFLDIFKTALAACRAIWNMFLIMPDAVFSKGGYGALPALIAARLLRIPLIIHDSDAVPGKVSLYSGHFAKRIGVAFPGAFSYFPASKTALVGIPIRKRILGGNREQARNELDISSGLPIIGFIGASQGAEKINEAIIPILKELTEEFEVLHQTGTKNFEDNKGEAGVVLEFAHKERYHPFGFLDERELRAFYLLSEIVVSRASATSIYEIAAWSKPSILIPLHNAAQDHQRKNAYEYAATGATVVIEEENLTPHVLLAEIRKLIANPPKMQEMRETAQRFARVDSAEILAKELLKLGQHQRI